eukprot:m.211730 g.211730  ORF g.211730 m.211730 type:complete len:112 (+) comp15561_c0_seq7:3267-3602(+)
MSNFPRNSAVNSLQSRSESGPSKCSSSMRLDSCANMCINNAEELSEIVLVTTHCGKNILCFSSSTEEPSASQSRPRRRAILPGQLDNRVSQSVSQSANLFLSLYMGALKCV